MNVHAFSVEGLVDEYDALLSTDWRNGEPGAEPDWAWIRSVLESEAGWTRSGADHVVRLARDYGVFVLRNALALSIALEIEDGALRL